MLLVRCRILGLFEMLNVITRWNYIKYYRFVSTSMYYVKILSNFCLTIILQRGKKQFCNRWKFYKWFVTHVKEIREIHELKLRCKAYAK